MSRIKRDVQGQGEEDYPATTTAGDATVGKDQALAMGGQNVSGQPSPNTTAVGRGTGLPIDVLLARHPGNSSAPTALMQGGIPAVSAAIEQAAAVMVHATQQHCPDNPRCADCCRVEAQMTAGARTSASLHRTEIDQIRSYHGLET